MLTCPLCQREMKALNSHVIRVHKMSIVDFRLQFPTQTMVCDDVKQRTSQTSKASGCGLWRKDSKLTGSQREDVSRRNTGSGNPFFGRKHSESSRLQMSENHANVSGDKNPFRNAMKDPNFKLKMERTFAEARQNRKNDSRRYLAYCETLSRATTQCHIDGKLTSYGRGHETGYYQGSKNSTTIFYRSSYERRFLELCENHQSISSVRSVDFSIPYVDTMNHRRRYVPDFIVNEALLIEIKAAFAISTPSVQLKCQVARQWCAERDWKFLCISSIDDEFVTVIDALTRE